VLDENEARVNLLTIEQTENDAENLVALLRRSGFAPHGRYVNSVDRLKSLFEEDEAEEPPEISLFSLDQQHISLSAFIEFLNDSGKFLPIIALTTQSKEDQIISALELGVRDVLLKHQSDKIRLVFRRELEVSRNWRKLKQTQSNLNEIQKFSRQLMDSSRDAIAYIHEGAHIYANKTYLDMFGFSILEELQGLPFLNLVKREKQEKFKQFLRKLSKSRSVREEILETELRKTSGQTFEANIKFTNTIFDNEESTQLIVREKNDASALQEQLDYLSQRDIATDMYNRGYFNNKLKETVYDASNGKLSAHLFYIGVDKFDSVRKSVGIGDSDIIIRDTANIIKKLVEAAHPKNIAARFEDDAFTVIAFREESLVRAEELADNILKEVAAHVCIVGGKSVIITVHIGMTRIDETSPEFNEVIERAINASTEAAKRGNSKVLYRPKEGEMTQREQDKVLVTKIESAIKENRMLLFFQPVVTINGENLARYEVLCRLKESDGKILEAKQFIDAAERLGVMKEVDGWVIDTAINYLKASYQKNKALVFFIKISISSMKSQGFLPWLVEKIKNARLPNNALGFEIKESSAVLHINEAKLLLKTLQQLRCQVIIDDFGSGVNSFQTLKHLDEATLLKVDCNIVKSLGKNKESQELLTNIIDNAHSLAKEVLVPCVENADTLSLVWMANANYVEGFFLQAPTEKTDFDFNATGF
jgi:diguanylate cyclase (GGDEF)-like protein/PAS domain S-box-containing protein